MPIGIRRAFHRSSRQRGQRRRGARKQRQRIVGRVSFRGRGAVARSAARARGERRRGWRRPRVRLPPLRRAPSIPSRRAMPASAAMPTRWSSPARAAPAPRRQARAPARRGGAASSGAPSSFAPPCSAGDRWRLQTPRRPPLPTATACRRRIRLRIRDASAQAMPPENGASTRTRAGGAAPRRAWVSASASSAGSAPSGEGASVGKALPSGRRTNPAASASRAHHFQSVAGVARSHSATIRLTSGQSSTISATSASGHDGDAHAPIASLRRDRDMMGRVGTGELVLEREAGGAGDARRGHRRQHDARDAHLRRGEHDFDPVGARPRGSAVPSLLHAVAGGIEERPRLRAIRRAVWRRTERAARSLVDPPRYALRGDSRSGSAHRAHAKCLLRARIVVVYSTAIVRSGHSTICQTIAGRAAPLRRTSARARECVAPWRASMVTRK